MGQHLRRARTPLIVVALVAAVVVFVSINVQQRRALAQTAPPPSDVAVAMDRAGLHPDALAAAGLGASDATAMVQALVSYLTEHPGELDLADAALADAKRDHDHLERRVRSGRSTPDEQDGFAAARLALTAAQAQRTTMTDAFFTSGTASLTAGERATLLQLRANRSWKLPTEFLVLDLEEPEWVALRDALANERISAKLGETPDAAAQALLQQLRSNPAVAAAKAGLDANLDLIRAAWEEEIGL